MAGDWIKMRSDLLNDPATFRLRSLTKLDKFSVVGRLYAFWAWADTHAVDGRVDGAASHDVDEIAQHRGFSDALVAVGWLTIEPYGILIPHHERHNGESAKERALKNKRQARWREKPVDAGPSTPPSTPPSTQASTREEKRREDITTRSKERAEARASRFALHSLPNDWQEFCAQERPDLSPVPLFEQFGDYWRAQPGKDGTKSDWFATWRNWVRKERKAVNGSHDPAKATAEALRMIDERERREKVRA